MQIADFDRPLLGLQVSEAVLMDCLLTILMKRADERTAALTGDDPFAAIRALSTTPADVERCEKVIKAVMRFQASTVERVWDRFCAKYPTAKGGGVLSLPLDPACDPLESEATPC